MSDIVARLRSPEVTQDDCSHIDLMQEAADEIEHLRAKIVLLHQIAGKASVEGQTFADIKKEIRSGKNAEG